MFMMMTGSFRIIAQRAVQQRHHRRIRISEYASKQADASLGQRLLGSRSNPAANQGIHTLLLQEARQSPVARAGRICELRFRNTIILDMENLELSGMSKMLKNSAVLIGYCDNHFSFILSQSSWPRSPSLSRRVMLPRAREIHPASENCLAVRDTTSRALPTSRAICSWVI